MAPSSNSPPPTSINQRAIAPAYPARPNFSS
jgi:hypothetical protein